MKNIFLLSLLIISGFLALQNVEAACLSVPLAGDYNVTSSCAFSGSVNGSEVGNIVIQSGKTLTINANQTVIWNSGYSVTIQGSIAINKNGGQLRKAYIAYPDASGRGYVDSFTATVSTSATPPAGYKRRSHTDFTSKWNYINQMAVMGTTTCTVRASCQGAEVSLLRLSATDNAHAELPSQSNYSNLLCCSASGSTIGNTCSGSYDTFLKLSGTGNAHVEKKTQSNYANSACISSSQSGSVVVCNYASSCSTLADSVATSTYSCLASISSGDTNLHVGDCNAYSTKVCCATY